MKEKKFEVKDIEDWLNLPTIEFQILRSDKETGRVFQIKKVGFVLAHKNDCKAKGLKAPEAQDGKSVLPTAVILSVNEYKLFSLPFELFEWCRIVLERHMLA